MPEKASFEDIVYRSRELEMESENQEVFTRNQEIKYLINSPGWKYIREIIDEKVLNLSNESIDSLETDPNKLLMLRAKAQAARELQKWLYNEVESLQIEQ